MPVADLQTQQFPPEVGKLIIRCAAPQCAVDPAPTVGYLVSAAVMQQVGTVIEHAGGQLDAQS